MSLNRISIYFFFIFPGNFEILKPDFRTISDFRKNNLVVMSGVFRRSCASLSMDFKYLETCSQPPIRFRKLFIALHLIIYWILLFKIASLGHDASGVNHMVNPIRKIKRAGEMKSIMIVLLISLLLLPSNVEALEMLSGDQIRVDSAVQDDVFAAGNVININAPVDGVVIAGGNININAPVNGDVFVTGGQISLNSDVSGKIVAAGGNIDIKGNARNVVVAGGNVNIHSSAVISRDAVIAGGTVNNAGRINGNLTVRAQNFQNTGSAGRVDFIKSEPSPLISTFRILITIGFLILGIIFLRLFPVQFFKVEEEIRKSTLLKTAVGFVLIIVSAIVIILVAVTIIGLPVAAVMAMLFIIGLMLSTIFVSFTLGKKILELFKLKTGDMWTFLLGFIILSLLFIIPYAGGLIQVVAISLGFGALIYAVREVWHDITRRQASGQSQ